MKPKFLGGRYIAREFTGRPCPYCGDPMLQPTKDHVEPKTKGGTLEDCIVVCKVCNEDKAGMSLLDFADRLRLAHDPRAAFVAKVILGQATNPEK